MEALCNLERKTVAEHEDAIIEYIGNTLKDTHEFPAHLGAYPVMLCLSCLFCFTDLIIWLIVQKMLAHRVAQAYGLATFTVDYEEGPGRVVASRTPNTRLRQASSLA